MATTGTTPGRGPGHRSGGVVRAAVGAFGEDVAARHLVAQGMVILDRNWRCPAGEIDLVARADDVLVVCEVKTRRGELFGSPAEAVDRRKAAKLRVLAVQWLAVHPVKPSQVRIDVVAVVMPRRGAGRGTVEVEHLVGVC